MQAWIFTYQIVELCGQTTDTRFVSSNLRILDLGSGQYINYGLALCLEGSYNKCRGYVRVTNPTKLSIRLEQLSLSYQLA